MENTNQHKVFLNGKMQEYGLVRKKVKNINLRIKSDGKVLVSANSRVSVKRIEEFLKSKADYILYHVDRFEKIKEEMANMKLFGHNETLLIETVERIYPIFEKLEIKYPTIKLREMKSRWGSCMPIKNQITLNKKLLKTPIHCIEYVVVHEFCHFIHPNHSKSFYDLVEKIMPDYKFRKKELEKYAVIT